MKREEHSESNFLALAKKQEFWQPIFHILSQMSFSKIPLHLISFEGPLLFSPAPFLPKVYGFD